MKTIKMKTRELTGPALDYAVFRALNIGTPWRYWGQKPPRYSTIWSVGGPVIERYGIGFFRWDKDTGNPMWTANTQGSTLQADGPSPLVAAMRLYVLSKLGEEIEIPEELV